MLFAPVSTYADEPISFNGIKFGMKADEIAQLGGGHTENGCFDAIKNRLSYLLYGGDQPWTYSGINEWRAECMEDNKEKYRVPGISGLFKISAVINHHKNDSVKGSSIKTYSVEGLVEIFSKIFGDFNIETSVVKNQHGKELIKKSAKAINRGAVITITEVMSDQNQKDFNFIDIKIISLDYLTKKNAETNTQKPSTKQCECILLAKYDLVVNFTTFNKAGHYLVSTSLASDKTYTQSHNCEDSVLNNSKDILCIGDCDSGNLSVETDEKGYKVKFGNSLRLDGGYNIDLGEPIGKTIIIEDRDYMRGTCIPCP